MPARQYRAAARPIDHIDFTHRPARRIENFAKNLGLSMAVERERDYRADAAPPRPDLSSEWQDVISRANG
jgi:hypothetical protein